MGSGRWSDSDWSSYSSTHVANKATVDDIYTSTHIHVDLDPKNIGIRESCDSDDNPESNALIVALDVTGSMDSILDIMARDGLKTLATEIYNRQPITDPHIMFMGVGDVESDEAPLQVTQFEADIRIAEELTKIYLERGGGGNDCESYVLSWYFAATRTTIDCFEKRNKKGYLFTVGDECPPQYLTSKNIKKFLGEKPEFDTISAEELLIMVSREYEVFHLIVEEGSFCRRNKDKVFKEWNQLLGQRAIKLSDHTKMGEVIISTIQVIEGENINRVVGSWDGNTALVVKNAIKDLVNSPNTNDGLIKF